MNEKEIQEQVKYLFESGELLAKCPKCKLSLSSLDDGKCECCGTAVSATTVLFVRNEKSKIN